MHYTRWRSHGDPLVSKYDRSIKDVTKMTEYKSWADMKSRCYHTGHQNYSNYGGRGITVCDDWRESFATFLKDVGLKPNPTYTLDRINNNDGYYPENCKWSSKTEQASNRRSNIFFTIDGETRTLKQWCDLRGLKYKTVWARVNAGTPVEKALY